MSMKRVKFDVDEEEQDYENEDNEKEIQKAKIPFNKKYKHTLESDEEDDELADERKYEFVEQDHFEGEEEGDLHREGEILITPFNIKDELKEGHFDNEGMYIFRKEAEDIKDDWIDNIDWTKVKDDTPIDQASSSKESQQLAKVDVKDCLLKLLELVNPNETVQKAIQRLGKSKLQGNANRNRNRNRKRMKTMEDGQGETSQAEKEDNERKAKLNNLIELSNQLMNDGNMEIFDSKHETLRFQLEQLEKKIADELDIFAD